MPATQTVKFAACVPVHNVKLVKTARNVRDRYSWPDRDDHA